MIAKGVEIITENECKLNLLDYCCRSSGSHLLEKQSHR